MLISLNAVSGPDADQLKIRGLKVHRVFSARTQSFNLSVVWKKPSFLYSRMRYFQVNYNITNSGYLGREKISQKLNIVSITGYSYMTLHWGNFAKHILNSNVFTNNKETNIF